MRQYSRILDEIFCSCMFLLLLISTSRSMRPITRIIKSEDGDIIDCVDIYKQPVFEHTLLKKHTINEMPPANFKLNTRTNTTPSNLVHQVWQRSGTCPKKTVPIRSMVKNAKFMSEHEEPNDACKIEHAGITANQEIFGARANINVWSVKVEPNEWSVSAISIYDDQDSYIQFGWMVSPTLYEDDGKPRLFVRRMDPSRGIDCFSLWCTGFVQTSNEYALGAALAPLSQYGGTQYEVAITIYKDDIGSRWCTMYGESMLGYWTFDQFPELSNKHMVFWGGQVCNRHHVHKKKHMRSKMGSGHLPLEGWGKSAYIRNIEVMDNNKEWQRPHKIQRNKSSSWCYMVGVHGGGACKGCAYFGGSCSIPCIGFPEDHSLDDLPLAPPRNFPMHDAHCWHALAMGRHPFKDI